MVAQAAQAGEGEDLAEGEHPDPNTRLSRTSFDAAHFAIAGAVAPASLVGDRLEPRYLATLVGASLDTIRGAPELVGGTPLLHQLAAPRRHTARFLAAARRDIARADAAPRSVLEPELDGLSTRLEPPWTWLQTRPHRSAAHCSPPRCPRKRPPRRLADPAFVDCWQGLATLADLSPRRLDALTREALDLASHRLDRVDYCRGVAAASRAPATSSPGFHVGAYGMVENARARLGRARRRWYPPLHVPSPAHAPTAGAVAAAATSRIAAIRRLRSRSTFGSARVRPRRARSSKRSTRTGKSRRRDRSPRRARIAGGASCRPAGGRQGVAHRGRGAGHGVPRAQDRRRCRSGQARCTHLHTCRGASTGYPPRGPRRRPRCATIVADAKAALDAVGDLLVALSIHQLAPRQSWAGERRASMRGPAADRLPPN